VVAALVGFLDGKDDFALSHVFGPWLIIRCGEMKSARFAHTAKAKTQSWIGKERPRRKTDVWGIRRTKAVTTRQIHLAWIRNID
jgi:hypothetical protein